MHKIYDPIFKFDTKKKARIWSMEQDGGRYRTIAGIKDGNLVTSEWTVCEPTNVGRSNERDAVAQATFEVEAAYEKKLTREYHRTLDAAGGGAHFFKPMLAQKYEKFEPGYVQPKLDGIRCIVNKDGMWSREGKPIRGAPHIFEMLKPIFDAYPILIFDGELYNHDLKDDFNKIVSLVKKQKPTEEELAESVRIVQYHAYDMPSPNSGFIYRYYAGLVGLPDHLFNYASTTNPVKLVQTILVKTSEEYDELHGQWLLAGYEGSIWRDIEAHYEQKRSKTLRKRKEFVDAEFEVVRIEEGLGNWSGAAKRVICKLPDGREFGAGIAGTYERGVELLKEKHKIATIKYFAMTPDGIPRFGVATKFHGNNREL